MGKDFKDSSPEERVRAKIHQCRLFKLSVSDENDPAKQFRFIEVWDTIGEFGEPWELYDEPPRGDPIVVAQNLSIEIVHQRMNAHRKRLGIVTYSCWRHDNKA